MIPLKYYAYLAAVLALLAGSWWLHNHLVSKGVEQQRAADAKALVELQHKADIETGRLQGLADAAEKAREKEHTDLDDYRRANPVHGGLCNHVSAATGGQAPTDHQVDGGTSASTWDVLPLLPGNSGTGGQSDPDIRGMFEALYGKCDELSASKREWQARQ